jgi:hypothetical protein
MVRHGRPHIEHHLTDNSQLVLQWYLFHDVAHPQDLRAVTLKVARDGLKLKPMPAQKAAPIASAVTRPF